MAVDRREPHETLVNTPNRGLTDTSEQRLPPYLWSMMLPRVCH